MLAAAATTFLLTGAVAVSYWLALHAESTLSSVGANTTLTGRTAIWHAVWPMIEAKPISGYGYGAFWIAGGPAVGVWNRLGQMAPHAHNGWLELWLEIGIVGVALFAWWLVRSWAAAWALMRSSMGRLASWPLVVLSMFVLENITEANFLARNTLFTVVTVAVAGHALGAQQRGELPVSSPLPVARDAVTGVD
jgi:O-antigen ligase